MPAGVRTSSYTLRTPSPIMRMAWRTELRLTPNVSVNSCSEGSFSPSFQVPWRIWSRSCSKTFSAIFTRVICLRAIKSTVPFVKVWYVWKMHTILYKIILTNTSIVKAGFRPKSKVFCTGPRKSIHSSLNALPHILFLLSREDPIRKQCDPHRRSHHRLRLIGQVGQ